MKLVFVHSAISLLVALGEGHAATITNPNDTRTWQGAGVGTFAQLLHGTDTLATRQRIVDEKLLDDGVFEPKGYTAAPLIQCEGCQTPAGQSGRSTDSTGTGSYGYNITTDQNRTYAGSLIDEYWLQTGNVIGGAIWDLGPGASTAIIFNTIDHGPLPFEAIESTVYLSNDKASWTQATTKRVWLEGFKPNTGILWDGFAYAVGTQGGQPFRYASVTWGGPGGLQADGDNEINGVMGANGKFEPPVVVPEPSFVVLVAVGLAALAFYDRKRKRTNLNC